MDRNVRIPLGLRARPLDFYVAFLVLFLGFSGLLDPTWPERFEDSVIYWVVMIEDIYLILASVAIMTSLLIREGKGCRMKVLIPSIIGEMFGWLFVSSAAWVIVLTAWWIPPSAVVNTNDPVSFWSWILVWVGLGISSFYRYIDLRHHYRSAAR
jgi:hypothetical protein